MWQTQRLERKFPIPESASGQALAVLKASAFEAPEFAQGTVNSVYFDSPELDAYFDALNGNFQKTKVRVRWYGEPEPEDRVDIFIELKSKVGIETRKIRTQQWRMGRLLQEDALFATMNSLGVGALLPSLGHFTTCWLRPVVQIHYYRHRFLDPVAGTPISLDLSIRSRLLDPGIATSPGWIMLRNAVIELKGDTRTVPPSLQALRKYLTLWASFSKYAHCVTGHLQRPGSAGWLRASL